MESRRSLLKQSVRLGLAAATAPLWCSLSGKRAFAQAATSSYKAVVVITLGGGNDGNNLLIPLDRAEYAEYSNIRTELALPLSSCLPIATIPNTPSYGLHPSLVNIASLYASKRAAIIANVGPLAQPATKQMLSENPSLYPQNLLDHPVCQQQWESATTISAPLTGWGGRIADLISSSSGTLPPVLNTAQNTIFSVGNTIQGVAVQSGGAYAAIPPAINAVILAIAQQTAVSSNVLTAQVAAFRANAMQQQVTLDLAIGYGTVSQSFTTSPLGKSLQTISQLLLGRTVVGASRQLFYAQQLGYDTHENQVSGQEFLFKDLDFNIGSFFAFLDSQGLGDQVLVCTHSDFCRTLTSNSVGGTDHAWGNHQLILGGGIRGGRIIGTMPTLELGGPDDYLTTGVWIPSLSVTQMTGAVGSWLGLNSSQLDQVFPDLAKFPAGALKLS